MSIPRQSGIAQRTPRIILVIGSLNCGGAERVLIDMANYWSRLGWEVTVATWNDSGAPAFYPIDLRIQRVALGVHASNEHMSPFLSLRRMIASMLKLRRLISDRKPDAVLSFIDASNVLTIIASAGLHARVVVSERTNPGQYLTISSVWRFLRPLTYRWATAVVAQTTDAARWLESHCRVLPFVIPNSIRRMAHVEVSRSPLILAIGRLSSEKGMDVLLRAFAMIRGRFPDWRVAIAGDGPERSALMALREQLDLVDRVDFIGQIREVEPWIASASLFVHASRREGFPNALLEAMAMGTPVICTDCPSGPSEIVQDGVNGRLIPVDDIHALASAIIDLIERPELRVRFASEGLKVRESYEQSVIMDRWKVVLMGMSA
jgi:GalNAc-alpha-(1->4)-GalNAc-alpha-(1->3)-diNAcBac-PP-undecaprenol alpha-1,4-N-acetyl-D-galactosaminyltransferase